MEIMDKGLTVPKLGADSFVKNTPNTLKFIRPISQKKRLNQAFVVRVRYYSRQKKTLAATRQRE